MQQNYIKYNAETPPKISKSFTGKERDSETGFSYFGARYYDSDILTAWLSVDPMADKYPGLSPYAYCAWNPVKLVDPLGLDTLNVTYNNKTQKWNFDTPIIASGNDVINVTMKNGSVGSVVFSEGEYGSRICNVTLEDNGKQTLSVFLLSGAGIAGYAVEPPGVADNSNSYDKTGIKVPIECGVYSISVGMGSKWPGWPLQYNNLEGSSALGKDRAVLIHYAWSKNSSSSQENLQAVNWTTKCAVVSSHYSMNNNGVILFNGYKSKSMAQQVARYCGASDFITRDKNYEKCIGIPRNCSVIRIVK